MSYKEKWGKFWEWVERSVCEDLAININPDCYMCGGMRDVCYHSLDNPCKKSGKKVGGFYHECTMIGRCPRCELVCAAYDFAMENGGKTNSMKLSKEFRLGLSSADKLCEKLEEHGIRIV